MILAIASLGCTNAAPPPDWLALVGGTVVDVANFGNSTRDLHPATVLIHGDRIERVGRRDQVPIPAGARVLDVSGKYLIPGLVDGFAGLNSQAHANAHLYMGVTTVAGSGDDRRGWLFLQANPSPHVYLLDGSGSSDEYDLLGDRPEWTAKLKGHDPDVELSPADNSRMMEEQRRMGVRGLWLGHNLTSANTRQIIAKARKLGLVTYGEFIATPYSDAIQAGVTLLLHMTRYELGLVAPEEQRTLADKAYSLLDSIPPDDPRVARYARLIAEHHVALMPTFCLYYADLPGHRNLWKDPIAAILDPKGVFHPTDTASGEPAYPSPAVKARITQMADRMWNLNRAFLQARPRYLAATGSAVFSSLPGISMHLEMELLVRLGLTPRQALAAATSNYSEQFGWRELGQIAPGRRADLVVLGADPTLDIRNSTSIETVILGGVTVDRGRMLNKP